jgi:hypothetical protein
MAEKISVQIELVGGAEVEQQLAAIGEAGQKAFDQINKAADQVEIEKVGEAGQTAAAGIDQVATASDRAGEEITKTGDAANQVMQALAQLGQAIARVAVDHETLIRTLFRLNGAFSTASRVVAAFTPELALVGVTVGSTAAAVAAGVLAFEALEKVATKLAASTEKLNNTLQTLAATSGQSFDNLQRGEAAFGQIGISAETFRGTIAKISETLAGTDTKNLTKGMSDIVALTKEIAAGQKGITFADWVTAEDKVKGVAIAMKQAADQGKNATQVLLEFIRNADLATSIKVGAAFGLSEADVDRVRRLGENINDLIQRIQGAPPLISPESAAAFDRMRTSIQNADSASARLKQSISTIDFQAVAANFSAIMNDMKAAALNAAAAISERLGQAFTGMMAQAKSDTAEIGAALSQLAQQTGALGLFKQMQADAVAANAVVANFVGSIMQGMGASAQSIKAVQDSINGITPATQAAGQAAQQTGVTYTQWGTAAQQGANTAQAAVQQTAVMYTSFGTVASQSGDKPKASMEQAAGGTQSLSDKVAAFASSLAGIAWDAISGAGVAAWNALTGAIQCAIDRLLKFIGLRASAPATGGSAPGAARGGLLGGRGTGTSDSNLAWLSRGEYIMPASAVRQPGVLSFLEALRRSGRIPGFAEGGAVGSLESVIGPIFNRTIQLLTQAFNAINQAMVAHGNSVKSINNSLIQSFNALDQSMLGVQNIIEAAQNTLQELQKAGGKAGGGLLGGRGTGTSDSNLAWVSRGEYITPAYAVRQPGVLAFLELLRRSGGNLRSVLDGMGRFALGGMAGLGPHAIPAFASGGLAGGTRDLGTLRLVMPDGTMVSGLTDSKIADALGRMAVKSQVRSGGRKPSRYS